MQGKRFSIKLKTAMAIFTVAFSLTSGWAGTQENVLHAFNPNGGDGAFPQTNLIVDASGNRYGTTYQGGTYNAGTVFELTPTEGGGWTEKVLHTFNNNGTDGYWPYAGLVPDAHGNLYGTTEFGGTPGGGTVFELTPNGSGSWTEKILHNFKGTDGASPASALLFDAAGNLYGTTIGGGAYYGGTVFELTLTPPHGNWTEKVLHSFNPNSTDGYSPYAGLVFDAHGNLYGTTTQGGAYTYGTVFELTSRGGGLWTEKVLHSFGNGTDGAYVYAGLVIDAAGNLYGTTYNGGTHSCAPLNGCGTVFELSPTQGGGWAESVLHNFNNNGTDGVFPFAGLILDGAGNLYGTAGSGGTYNSGIAFELTSTQGGWTEKVLHTFNNNGTDGAYPDASLILDTAGNLYSTTYNGGTGSVGTAFELTPEQGGGWTEKILYSFYFNGTDGANPSFANLIFDSSGNLYGMNYDGGTYDAGTVFELTPSGGGGWTEKILHNFKNNDTDGGNPYGGLIFDVAGNLYGTTLSGGTNGSGTVFELTPAEGGGWISKVLHNFNSNGGDGAFPFAGVVFDIYGNLYGTTYQGGRYGSGTVFELTPTQGSWTEQVLHSFQANGTDGGGPWAGLVIDASGNLYGTTLYGGAYGAGTAFGMTLSRGSWTEQVLHSFDPNGTDGYLPYGGLLLDAAHNLYGTTSQGGTNFAGTVFELTPSGGGWAEQVLYSFEVNGMDGFSPQGSLTSFGDLPDLYGTTTGGGAYRYGTVFELTPTQGGTWIEAVLHSFGNGTDGSVPSGGLIFDPSGNLYGMTNTGGTFHSGTVFDITSSRLANIREK